MDKIKSKIKNPLEIARPTGRQFQGLSPGNSTNFSGQKSKFKRLKEILKKMGSVVVAFSGGVDSTFLLKVAKDTLDGRVIAVTACSETYPESEFRQSKRLAKLIGTRQIIIRTEELKKKDFYSNPPDRCYWCKSELFREIENIREEYGFNYIADGTNFSDTADFRPGQRAEKEFSVRRPLFEAGFTKEDIRKFSKKLGLPTHSKPAMACLASRFPYHSKITAKKLKMVEEAEEYLNRLGFCWIRVRHHGNIARIEVHRDEMNKFLSVAMRGKISRKFRQIGFKYITVDIEGYRTGSMNEVLNSSHSV